MGFIGSDWTALPSSSAARRAAAVASHPPAVGRTPAAASGQGLILIHFSAQRKNILWGTLGE